MYLNQYKTEIFEESWKGALAGLALGASSLLSHGATNQPTVSNTITRPAAVSNNVPQNLNLASQFIRSQENSKNNKEGGWNNKLQKWFPHPSKEGGRDTIGYGHKLSSNKEAISYKSGITDKESEELLQSDINRSYRNINRKLHKAGYTLPTNKYAVAMLLDIEFNVRGGITTFPKFVGGLMTNNVAVMTNEYRRYGEIEGVKQELGRNKAFKSNLLDPYLSTLKK